MIISCWWSSAYITHGLLLNDYRQRGVDNKERRGEEEGRGGVRGMERNSEERRRKERRSE